MIGSNEIGRRFEHVCCHNVRVKLREVLQLQVEVCATLIGEVELECMRARTCMCTTICHSRPKHVLCTLPPFYHYLPFPRFRLCHLLLMLVSNQFRLWLSGKRGSQRVKDPLPPCLDSTRNMF